jgi:ABC-type polysaccharide/polyol phosphate export permease
MRASAIQDFQSSVRDHWRVWINLGIRDIRARYRRTVIGPFWTVLSSFIMIIALGLVYALLWKVEIREFLPYFCAGYITWILFTTNINESCSAFINSEAIIKSLSLPYLIHILRVIWRNLLVFAHNLVVYAVVLIFFNIWPGWALLWVPIALLLLSLNVLWIGVVVAVLGARFRDLIQIVASILQVLFFVTPIFWPVDKLNEAPAAKFILSDANLAYHLVEIVRAPLSGRDPPSLTVAIMICSAIAGNLLGMMFFNRLRSRIAYWL